MGRYRTIDHTADAGLEVEGETLADLFTAAGEGFCDLICDRSTVRRIVERKVTVEKGTREELLQGYLSGLLYRFDTEHELYSEITITAINESRLTALLKGEKIDPSRHEIRMGIKAVTFHQLKVRHEGEVWKARVIFDV